MLIIIIHAMASVALKANSAYRSDHAASPMINTHLIPNFLKNYGRDNRNNTSDIWPNVILKPGFSIPAVFRKIGTYGK